MSQIAQAQKVHWKKLTNPLYIGAYDFQPGEERTVEIVKVVREQVTGPDGKKEECTVAHLKDEKPFILNVTNCKTLAKLYRTPFIEDWVGKSIILYVKNVRAFGDTVDALRIKDTLPALPELTPSHEKWTDAYNALHSGKVTIETILSRFYVSKENLTLLNTQPQ